MRQHQRPDRHCEPAEDRDQPATAKAVYCIHDPDWTMKPRATIATPIGIGQPDPGPRTRRFPWQPGLGQGEEQDQQGVGHQARDAGRPCEAGFHAGLLPP
jgi:hypothetical protein